MLFSVTPISLDNNGGGTVFGPLLVSLAASPDGGSTASFLVGRAIVRPGSPVVFRVRAKLPAGGGYPTTVTVADRTHTPVYMMGVLTAD